MCAQTMVGPLPSGALTLVNRSLPAWHGGNVFRGVAWVGLAGLFRPVRSMAKSAADWQDKSAAGGTGQKRISPVSWCNGCGFQPLQMFGGWA